VQNNISTGTVQVNTRNPEILKRSNNRRNCNGNFSNSPLGKYKTQNGETAFTIPPFFQFVFAPVASAE
jgi:hypothetical protein